MDPNEGIYSKFQHSVGVLKVPVVNGLIDVALSRKVVLDCRHSMVALIRGTKLYLNPAGFVR